MKITTILQTYKRPQYFSEQYQAIKNQTIKSDKIIVVQNEGGCKFDYPDDVELIYANPNRKYHLRFVIGLLEDCDYLFFYDDDSVPGINWQSNCIETIEKHDCICVSNARNVLLNGSQDCPAGWANNNENEVKCWFGGHAIALRKKNLKYMFFDDIQNYNNGEDIQLSCNAWLYGNIPTYCPRHPKNDKSLWGSLYGREMGSDSAASWTNNPIHYPERIKLIQHYLNKGWNPLQ